MTKFELSFKRQYTLNLSKNLIYRTLTGIVFVTILLSSILCSQYLFVAIFGLIELLALSEYHQLISQDQRAKLIRNLNLTGGFLLFICTFISFLTNTGLLLSFIPYLLFILLLFILQLYVKNENPIRSLAYSLLGQVYIAVPFSLLHYLAYSYDYLGQGYHHAYLLALFVIIWVNDSFAYVFGVTLGKHRLFERISPKKSWEGFIGGMICAIGSGAIFSLCYDAFPLAGWIGFAVVIVVFGTFGDLVESLFKRTLNVKDSGTLLPGHGGILDRFDSMIFAIPALVAYIEIFNYVRELL
jgi:phosphatidate cytidylyltransferase